MNSLLDSLSKKELQDMKDWYNKFDNKKNYNIIDFTYSISINNSYKKDNKKIKK